MNAFVLKLRPLILFYKISNTCITYKPTAKKIIVFFGTIFFSRVIDNKYKDAILTS